MSDPDEMPDAKEPAKGLAPAHRAFTEEDERSYVRADFDVKVLKTDDATRHVWMALVPDPRRYREVVRDGKKIWEDKYLSVSFSEDTLGDMVRQLGGMPISHLPRHIDDAVAYTEERRRALDAEIDTGEHIPPAEELERHPVLALTPAERSMTFLSIDICNSTVLQAKIGDAFDQCFQIFFREMANTVAEFSGRIFKATGDGLIAYIDTTAINTQCDAAVDMGLTLLRVLKDAVNPALEKAGLPALQIRVGAEHGRARVRVLSVPSIELSAPEIAANALNRAVKVEKTCTPNTFRIGEALYRRIHVQWLERAELTTTDISADIGLPDYKIFLIE